MDRRPRLRSSRPGGRAGTLRERAAEILGHQRRRMRESLGAAIDGRDPEGVHRMRVASRRLRAALRTFRPWLDGAELDRLAAAVRGVTRALGDVRELDVARLSIAAWARRARPERALALEQVDARLARRRRRARARMIERFARIDLDRLDERLGRLVAELERGDAPAAAAGIAAATATAGPEPLMRDLLADRAAEIATTASDLVRDLPEPAGTAESAEALHRVRIDAKKLRYTLEIVAPELGPAGRAVVRRLRRLQDRLGAFHDDVVLDGILGREIARATDRSMPLLAAQLRRIRGARRRALARAEAACRDEVRRLATEGFADAVRRALAEAGTPADERARAAASAPAVAAGREGGAGVGASAGASTGEEGAAAREQPATPSGSPAGDEGPERGAAARQQDRWPGGVPRPASAGAPRAGLADLPATGRPRRSEP